MSTTKIEWADATWNPIRARRLEDGKVGWHCEKVSAGCLNCYAETFNGRRLPNGGTGLAYGKRQRAEVETFVDEAVLREPLRWRKPRRVFVCSMTDLFGEWVSDEQIDRAFAVMALAPQHTFMVLTKRAERMREYFADTEERSAAIDATEDVESVRRRVQFDDDQARSDSYHAQTGRLEAGIGAIARMWYGAPLPNVWLGVSVEDQAQADARIPHLLRTRAAVRFVSAEPLLGQVDLRHWVEDFPARSWRVDWIIVGGESGPGARPCDAEWVRSIVEQTREHAACFVKQLGARSTWRVPNELRAREGAAAVECEHGYDACPQCDVGSEPMYDPKGGDPSEWPEDLRVREFPVLPSARQERP